MSTAREWFSAAEIAEAKLPGFPTSLRGINRLALERGWRAGNGANKIENTGGRPGWEYHVSLFSDDDQLRLLRVHSSPANDDRDAAGEAKAAASSEGDRLGRATGTGSITLAGLPEAMADAPILTTGFRAEANGLWRAASVDHTFGDTYMTTIELEAPEAGKK